MGGAEVTGHIVNFQTDGKLALKPAENMGFIITLR